MSMMIMSLIALSSLIRLTTLTTDINWLFRYDLVDVALVCAADVAIILNSALAFFLFHLISYFEFMHKMKLYTEIVDIYI